MALIRRYLTGITYGRSHNRFQRVFFVALPVDDPGDTYPALYESTY